MAVPTTEVARALLYQALASPIGIVVQTDDHYRCKNKLYTVRKSLADPDLLRLQIHTSPVAPETEVWIVKGGQISAEDAKRLIAKRDGDGSDRPAPSRNPRGDDPGDKS